MSNDCGEYNANWGVYWTKKHAREHGCNARELHAQACDKWANQLEQHGHGIMAADSQNCRAKIASLRMTAAHLRNND